MALPHRLAKHLPGAYDQCLCGSGIVFKRCCYLQREVFTTHDSDAFDLYNEGRYDEALARARAELTRYRLWHLAHTVPMPRASPTRSQLVEIDAMALDDYVALIRRCYDQINKRDEFPRTLDRLTAAVDSPRWRERLLLQRAISALGDKWDENAAREVFAGQTLLAEATDPELLELYLDVCSDSIGFAERQRIASTIVAHTEHESHKLQYRMVSALALFCVGDRDDAVRQFKSAIAQFEHDAKHPYDAYAQHQYGMALSFLATATEDRPTATRAIEALVEARRVVPYTSAGQANIDREIAFLLANLGEWSQSIERYGASLKTFDDPVARIELATTWMRAGNVDEGRRALEGVSTARLDGAGLLDYTLAQARLAIATRDAVLAQRIDGELDKLDIRVPYFRDIRHETQRELRRISERAEQLAEPVLQSGKRLLSWGLQRAASFLRHMSPPREVEPEMSFTSNRTNASSERRDEVTVGIVTALPKEFAAVLAMLDSPVSWFSESARGSRRYTIGEMPSADGRTHVVALAMLPDMGTNNASLRAGKLLNEFPRVEHIIMCGIAGGVPQLSRPTEHVRLGDVVISDRNGVVQFDNLKLETKKLEIRSPPRPPSAELLESARYMEAQRLTGERPWHALIERARSIEGAARPPDDVDAQGSPYAHPEQPGRRPGTFDVHYATIASSNTLLKDPTIRDYLSADYRVKAVEMEGSGIADATWDHGVGYLVVRGICDYCDDAKGDTWQGYAAAAAAAVVRCLLGLTATRQR